MSDVRWLVIFDDADRGTAVFNNEADAREFVAKASPAWNHSFMVSVTLVDELRVGLDRLHRIERAALRWATWVRATSKPMCGVERELYDAVMEK